jgi:hypothetical protein
MHGDDESVVVTLDIEHHTVIRQEAGSAMGQLDFRRTLLTYTQPDDWLVGPLTIELTRKMPIFIELMPIRKSKLPRKLPRLL